MQETPTLQPGDRINIAGRRLPISRITEVYPKHEYGAWRVEVDEYGNTTSVLIAQKKGRGGVDPKSYEIEKTG